MIEVRDISFFHGKRTILHGISFDVCPGECVGILGVNGAGKSTLLSCLNGLRRPATGSVMLDGVDILTLERRDRARLAAYVAQKVDAGHMTVFDAVLLGRTPHVRPGSRQKDIAMCADMLDRIGLASLAMRPLRELSGGEAQKVMLARALVQEPRMLLLDEPTSNLDLRNQHDMLYLVRTLARERGIVVLMVLHDPCLALRFCDRFLFLKNGTVFRYGDSAIFHEDVLRQVYGIETRIIDVEGRKLAVVA